MDSFSTDSAETSTGDTWNTIHDFELRSDNIGMDHAIGISFNYFKKGRADKLYNVGEEYFSLTTLID